MNDTSGKDKAFLSGIGENGEEVLIPKEVVDRAHRPLDVETAHRLVPDFNALKDALAKATPRIKRKLTGLKGTSIDVTETITERRQFVGEDGVALNIVFGVSESDEFKALATWARQNLSVGIDISLSYDASKNYILSLRISSDGKSLN